MPEFYHNMNFILHFIITALFDSLSYYIVSDRISYMSWGRLYEICLFKQNCPLQDRVFLSNTLPMEPHDIIDFVNFIIC
jgi:hypothetical protein